MGVWMGERRWFILYIKHSNVRDMVLGVHGSQKQSLSVIDIFLKQTESISSIKSKSLDNFLCFCLYLKYL